MTPRTFALLFVALTLIPLLAAIAVAHSADTAVAVVACLATAVVGCVASAVVFRMLVRAQEGKR
jgi:heme/copper-type cytochrome/quinol oxidase subunit 4